MEEGRYGDRERNAAPTEWFLRLGLYSAKEIDNPPPDSRWWVGNSMLYFVSAWVESDYPDRTHPVYGVSSAFWNEELVLRLRGKPRGDAFVHLEVVRLGFYGDPGTSSGEMIVGRARSRLPGPGKGKNRMVVPLVKPTGGYGGEVVAGMKLEERRVFQVEAAAEEEEIEVGGKFRKRREKEIPYLHV